MASIKDLTSLLFTISLSVASFCACSSSDSSNTNDSDDGYPLTEADTVTSPEVANLHNPLPSIPTPQHLSGNFGELRNNHFHSGLDFKTNGRTGYRVAAADSGFVSRIVVSPWGFGRAVYVEHPRTGLTTVYGHLESFSPDIDKKVRDEQYRRQQFSIDMTFAPGEIPVARGASIGRSGNAGSSGGPHLHMDVRHTATGDPVDPMPYFKTSFADKTAPEMRKLTLYAVDGEGYVDNATKNETAPYRFKAWGKVYPGIKAYDRMDGTRNIYGVKHMRLTVDGRQIYSRDIDRVAFGSTRAVHTLIHFPSLKCGGEWIMTTRVPESGPLPDMIEAEGNGILDIDAERDYACVFTLEDEMGNVSKIPFTITGVRSGIPEKRTAGHKVRHNRDFIFHGNGIEVTIPAAKLYDDMQFTHTASSNGSYLSAIHKIGDYTVPLAGPIAISVEIADDSTDDKSKYCLVRLNDKGNGSRAIAARYINGRMVAEVKDFGRYAVTTDQTPPTVTRVKKTAKDVISFILKDNLSGIASYRGEIDGKFALFELDGKTARASFTIDRSRFKPTGKPHKVTMTATDACGNTTTVEDTVTF